MTVTFFLGVLASGVLEGTPILYASLGEVIAESSGVMNLGVEGMMLVGAVSGFAVGTITSNAWLGILVAMLLGCLLALIHAVLTICLKANQVASGIALTIFGTGLSAYLGHSFIGTPPTSTFNAFNLPLLSSIPILNKIFFEQDILVYIGYMLVIFIWVILYKTKIGLLIRATGEYPGAVDSEGHNVFWIRFLSVIVGGALAGAGGAYLSLAYSPSWVENMTAGKGWIAVALVIFATWNPVKAMLGAYLFGVIDSLGLHCQAIGIQVPSQFLQMLPYIFTFIILILTTSETKNRRSKTPLSLCIPYSREER